MEVAFVLEATVVSDATVVLGATVVLETASGTGARALHSALPTVESAPGSPIGVGRGGEGEGQYPHERETDQLPHGQLLLDGLHGCDVSPACDWSAGAPISASAL
jgi:hypothetical protein